MRVPRAYTYQIANHPTSPRVPHAHTPATNAPAQGAPASTGSRQVSVAPTIHARASPSSLRGRAIAQVAPAATPSRTTARLIHARNVQALVTTVTTSMRSTARVPASATGTATHIGLVNMASSRRTAIARKSIYVSTVAGYTYAVAACLRMHGSMVM